MPDDVRQMPPLARQIEAGTAGLPGADLDWLGALRAAGRREFTARGLPSRKVEAWKFTDLRRLEKIDFTPAPPEGAAVSALPVATMAAIDGPRAVLVNGRFDPTLSTLDALPAGVTVASLAEVLDTLPDAVAPHLGKILGLEGMPLAALNAAAFADGLVVRVDAGAIPEQPLHIVSIGAALSEAVAFHPRVLVLLEDGASATLIESHVGDGVYLANTVAEVRLGEKAILNHYKLQNEGPEAFHIAATGLHLADGAAYERFTLQMGARLARDEVRALLDGRRIDCRLDGAYLATGKQHLDNTTFVDHAHPESRSRQVYKGVLDQSGHGVFQGKILVRPHAQKTDGHQLSRALLLSRQAEMNGKPELEIYADDVKCSHGATVGELDEDPLFYLRARGIDEESARRMLIEAFIAEVIDDIGNAAVREIFADMARGWLESGRDAV